MTRAVTFFHRLQLTWELNRSLARRKVARPARQEAARRAVSTQIKRRAARCREVFGWSGCWHKWQAFEQIEIWDQSVSTQYPVAKKYASACERCGSIKAFRV